MWYITFKLCEVKTDLKGKMGSVSKSKDMVFTALFAVLIAVCSWISVLSAIPFTMQTFGVFLTLNILGGKRGTLCIIIYLLMGIVGIPVFSNGTAGIGVIMGTTGGYLIGWIFSGLVMWLLQTLLGRKIPAQAVSMAVGLLVCYTFGTAWFTVVYARTTGAVGLWTALCRCVFPFVIPDLIKLTLALVLTQRLNKTMEKYMRH